jgi:hypothetical protein
MSMDHLCKNTCKDRMSAGGSHLDTQEAEIRRIVVQSQPGQIVHELLSQKHTTQKIGLAEWFCPPSKHEALCSN